MTPTAPRTLTLIDVMILIAATAIGLAGLRASVGDFAELSQQLHESLSAFSNPPNGWSSWSWGICSFYGLAATVLVPFCWSWTLALLAIHLRRPRPRRRRLASRPGAMACFAAGLTLVPALIGPLCLCLVSGSFSWADFQSTEWQKGLGVFYIFLPAMTGFTVAGAWTCLILGRRWRAEPSWIDRAGRVLGVYWIGAILLPAWGLL
jgi:hypothetical protein